MRKLSVLIFAAALLVASPAWAVVIVPGTATAPDRSSGVNGESLSDTPVTDTIPIGSYGGKVELSLIVTAGTTASFTAQCEHSEDSSNWAWFESTTAAGAASIATITYTIADGTARTLTIVTGHRYIRCTFDDAADGTGTIIVRGNIAPDRR